MRLNKQRKYRKIPLFEPTFPVNGVQIIVEAQPTTMFTNNLLYILVRQTWPHSMVLEHRIWMFIPIEQMSPLKIVSYFYESKINYVESYTCPMRKQS